MVFNLAVIESISYELQYCSTDMKNCTSECCADLLLKLVGIYFSYNRTSFWQELPHQTPCFKLIEDGLQTNTASAIHLQTCLSNIL
jgi:hypothetical protein